MEAQVPLRQPLVHLEVICIEIARVVVQENVILVLGSPLDVIWVLDVVQRSPLLLTINDLYLREPSGTEVAQEAET